MGEVFKEALKQDVVAIIVAHNHPSGDPMPSAEDVAVTREIVEVDKLLSTDVIDHLVIGRGPGPVCTNVDSGLVMDGDDVAGPVESGDKEAACAQVVVQVDSNFGKACRALCPIPYLDHALDAANRNDGKRCVGYLPGSFVLGNPHPAYCDWQ